MLAAVWKQEEGPALQSPAACLVLPLALVVLIAGANGSLTAASGLGLLVLALLAGDLYRSEEPHGGQRFGSIVLGSVVAIVPGAVLVFVVREVLQHAALAAPGISPEVAPISLTAPAVMVPCLVRTLRRALAGNPTGAIRLSGMVAIITLGALLPGVVLADYFLKGTETGAFAPIPPLSWRVDGALLVVAGFGLVAMRFDVLRPARWVALLHVVLYLAYVLAATALRLI
jgi:hypothetical protein